MFSVAQSCRHDPLPRRTLDAYNVLVVDRPIVTPAYPKQVMAAIDWMPGRNGCVAVSAVKNLNFNERVKVSGQVKARNRRGRGSDRPVSYNVKSTFQWALLDNLNVFPDSKLFVLSKEVN